MNTPAILLAAVSLSVTASSTFAVLSMSESAPVNGVLFDDVATALRGLGKSFWDQNDDLFNPETATNGSLLFTTSIDYGMGMTDVDWLVKTPYVMDFATSEMTVAGIFSEAGDRNMLRATDADGSMDVVTNKSNKFKDKIYTVSSDTGMIEMDLHNLSQGTGPFDTDAEVIFGEAMIEGKYFGLFVFDDRFPSLDNHDDFIGLVDVHPEITTTPVPEPSTIIGLVALGFIAFTVRSKIVKSRK